MGALRQLQPSRARWRSLPGITLALALVCPAHAGDPPSSPRFEIRTGTLREGSRSEGSRFALSARLQRPAPATEPGSRFEASAQVKAIEASCDALGTIFRNGFEGA